MFPNLKRCTIVGCVVVSLFFMPAWVVSAVDDLPPKSLLRENTTKASAIVQGMITASEMPKGQLAATTLRVAKVYKGPLRQGDLLTYYSFKEQANYADEWKKKVLVVYLTRRRDSAGAEKWYTATDIAEFVYSDQLEQQVRSLLGRK